MAGHRSAAENAHMNALARSLQCILGRNTHSPTGLGPNLVVLTLSNTYIGDDTQKMVHFLTEQTSLEAHPGRHRFFSEVGLPPFDAQRPGEHEYGQTNRGCPGRFREQAFFQVFGPLKLFTLFETPHPPHYNPIPRSPEKNTIALAAFGAHSTSFGRRGARPQAAALD